MTVGTAEALAQLPGEWTVFHDLPWPGQRDATIEHVAVGPGGVFVIDSAESSGRRQVRRDVLRRNGRLRERTATAATQASEALLELVPELEPWRVRPVVCVDHEDQVMGWARKVMVCSPSSLVPMILTHPDALNAKDRARVTSELALELRAAGSARSESSRRRAPRHSADHKAPRRRAVGQRSRPLTRAALAAGGTTVVLVAAGVVTNLGQHLSSLVG
jgi:hypothetical protein